MSTQPESLHSRSPSAPLPFHDEYSTSDTASDTADEQRFAAREASLQDGASIDQLARGLGWFSIALGATQLLAPRQLSRFIGADASPALMRALGARELASGIAILAVPSMTAAALKARVAGDAMDLALLGSAMTRDDSDRTRVAAATLAVLGVTGFDLFAARNYDSAAEHAEVIIDIRRSIAINTAPEKLYDAWRDFEQLPRIMRHLHSVQVLDEGRSHWVAKAPAGMKVEWQAEVIADEPGRLLAWRSLPGSQVENMGSVRFEPAPGGRGTLLTVELEYRPPIGTLGRQIARLFGEEPDVQMKEDLRRFKQLIETGEIPTTRSQPAGPRSLKYRLLSTQEPAHAR